MMTKMIPVACLTAMLAFGVPSMAQVTDLGKQAGQAVGQVGKDVTKATGEAAKKVGTAGKKTAKNVGSSAKEAVTGVPKGATGECKDGTYTKAKSRSGACSKHGGVDKWF